MIDLEALVDGWPVPTAAVGMTNPTNTVALGGDPHWVTPLASISKLFAALTALVAYEEGTIDFDEPAGPPGSTVRHLLAHASGLSFDEHRSIGAVGAKRVYSNSGIEQFADHLADRAAMPFETYLREAVIEPLGLEQTRLEGSPAAGMVSSVADLLRLGREFLEPSIIAPATLREATTPQFADLSGVLPGFGAFRPNPWGLGIELKGDKSPHWTAPEQGPATFGHFGAAGTFLWIDPVRSLATVALTDRDFGAWAIDAWPAFSSAAIDLAS